MSVQGQPAAGIGREWWALGVLGLVGAGAGVAGGVVDPAPMLAAYLGAYAYWLGIALGCLAVLMMHQLTGGRWGWPARRFAEAGAGTVPLLAVAFLPIALGAGHLYPWAAPGADADPDLRHKAPYLNLPFFLVRATAYFLVWGFLARQFRRGAVDVYEPVHARPGLRRWSAGGLLLLAVTGSFAFIDWFMSLEPAWYSTIYPAMVGVGMMLTAFAFLIALVALAEQRAGLGRPSARQRRDLAGLLFAWVMLWGYLAFSQVLLIWSGNLPEEISWYLTRIDGPWRWVAVLVAVSGGILPFLLLLPADTREHRGRVLFAAGLLLAGRYADTLWLVRPPLAERGLGPGWQDLLTGAALGCLWLAGFAWLLRRRPPLPLDLAPEQPHPPVLEPAGAAH